MSRNKGLKLAKGEYIVFCDHDDILKHDACQMMYEKAIEKNADIVLGVPEYCYQDPSLNRKYYYPQEGNVRNNMLKAVIGESGDLVGWNFYFSHGVIWGKMYRNSFIKKHDLNFVDNRIVTFEDNLFLIESLFFAQNAEVLNEVVYYHTIEDTNTASTLGYVDSTKVLNYVHYLYDFLKNKNVYDEYCLPLSNSVTRYIIGCISREMKRRKNKLSNIGLLIKSLENDKIVKECFRTASYKVYIGHSNGFLKKIYHTAVFLYLRK